MITFIKITHKKISQSNKLYEREGAAIWYIQQCEKGQEKAVVQSWNQLHQSEKAEAFFFTYERMKRYEGAWHLLEEPLFPGVIFLEYQEGIPSDGQTGRETTKGAVSLDPETEQFLRELGGRAHRVPMSKGIIRNGTTIVTEGPLEGKESCIRKIDRHKRLARIAGPFNVPVCKEEGFWMGLEITSKS